MTIPILLLKNIREIERKGGANMNADLDFLGMLNLLKSLLEKGLISRTEMEKITVRLRVQTGAKIVVYI